MKKGLHHKIVFIVLIIVGTHPLQTSAEETVVEPPELQAEAALLMEAQSGQILYSHNPDETMYPASITKILTGLIAIESGQLEETVTVSENAVHAGGTRVYLEVGEQKQLIDLVYGMLVNSGNDAAIAIAEHLGGSIEGFAKMMNERARELGATKSNFVNPSGMPDEAHVTTARDMALITQYAMLNDTFREIVGTKEYPWEGDGWQPGNIVNHNRLLWDYEGATGVKNGYTDAAQQTFVATSERNGQQLIAVCLKVSGAAENMYRDLTALMDYGYDAFETHRLVLNTEQLTELSIDGEAATGQLQDDVSFVTLPKGTSVEEVEQNVVLNQGVSLPVSKGDVLGSIQLSFENEVIQEIPFEAKNAIAAVTAEREEKTELAGFPWIMWLMSLLIFSWCLLYFRRQYRRRQKLRSHFQGYRSYRG